MTLLETLSSLESAGLLRVSQVKPELEYLFRHTLVQDAAYNSLLDQDRTRLHRAVGEALENLYQEQEEDYAAILAHHYLHSGDLKRAYKYVKMAAETSLQSFANQEAEAHFRSGLKLTQDPEEQAELYTGLGTAVYQQGRFQEAINLIGEGIQLYRTLGERGKEAIARSYALSARIAWYAGDPARGLELAQKGLEEVGAAPPSPGLAQLIHEIARAYYFTGVLIKAREIGEQALEMATRVGAVAVEADTLATLGIIADQSAEESLRALERSVELSEAHGLLNIAQRAHHNLGVIYSNRFADDDRTREHYLRAAELAKIRGVVEEEMFTRANVAGLLLQQGRFDAFKETLSYIEHLIMEAPGAGVGEVVITMLRAQLAHYSGDWELALQLQRKVLESSLRQDDLQHIVEAKSSMAETLIGLYKCRGEDTLEEAEGLLKDVVDLELQTNVMGSSQAIGLAYIAAEKGRFEEAESWLKEAEARGSSADSPWHEGSMAYGRGLVAARQRQWDQAFSELERTTQLFCNLKRPFHWAQALWEWGEAHLTRQEPGDRDRGQALLRESVELLERIGATGYAECVQERLNSLRDQTIAQAAAGERAAQDMARARRVQQGFLPERIPEMDGWQLSAKYLPASEISGDFYDLIPLEGDRMGILIADVADKGAAAALYMTSTRTLVRTYADEFPDRPEMVLEEVNRRILAETHSGLFVTVFYGVLELRTGEFAYANAGHNPPLYLRSQGQNAVQTLGRTGVPLGIYTDFNWEQGSIQIDRGGMLVAYTDGVTESQNPHGEFFGQEGLQDLITQDLVANQSAEAALERFMQCVKEFVGSSHLSDDMTMMVLLREP